MKEQEFFLTSGNLSPEDTASLSTRPDPPKAHKVVCNYVSNIFSFYFVKYCGPGSSVGIATDYWMDGPGSNPSEDEIFRPSTPALGPTQSPVK